MILTQKKNNDVLAVTITDEIGNGFYAQLKSSISGNEFKELQIELCSEGGVLTEAFAAYNFLKTLPQKVTITVTGWAASAATYLLMAADHIVMQENSFLMIHEPSVMLWEDVNLTEAERLAAVLGAMRDTILTAYGEKSSLSTATLQLYMKDETWMSAQEALEYGFCDEIRGVANIAAKAVIPENLKEKIMAKKKIEIVNQEPEKEKLDPVPAPAASAEETAEEVNSEGENPEEVKAEEGTEEKPDLLAELEKRVTALEEENEILKNENAELKEAKATAEEELTEVKNRISRIHSGVKTPAKAEEKAPVSCWKDAMKACGGDYQEARKKYPEIFAKLMNACK